MKFYLILILSTFLYTAQAQVIFEENFDSGPLDSNWEIETLATDGGWIIGTPSQLSSAYFTITDNGTSNAIGTNDDGCNCNKINDRLITPAIDLTTVSLASLSFDLYYGDMEYSGAQESLTLNISTDKLTWVELKDLENTEGWKTELIDLSEYAGQVIYLSFDYSDDNGWTFGCAFDNLVVGVPFNLDGGIVKSDGLIYGEFGTPYEIPLELFNQGVSQINELELSYSINGGASQNQIFDNLSVDAYSTFNLHFTEDWVPDTVGENNIEISIVSVNGVQDDDPANNNYGLNVEVFEKVTRPNIIDEIVKTIPLITPIADFSNQLDKPTDLAFFPILGKNELWIINQRNENAGGSTVIVSDASVEPSGFEHQVDGNSWHFMSLPTGMAFSTDNYNFATSPGVQDANHSGGTFTGPTLWSSDPLIYAKPSGGNGSHLDMLHGSPFSMGIAHEVDNVFWVYDDWNNDIVRYDFVKDHGPGNDDHSDAIIRRYKNIGISKVSDIPNHMIMDKETGWLYFIDNGSARVMRLDINSGVSGGSIPEINEPLAEHSIVVDFTVEEIINTGLIRPCGIEMIENRLLVSDYDNGDIIVYDMDNEFAELGRLETFNPGITGITVGPEGNIWYTNRLDNQLMKVETGQFSANENIGLDLGFEIYPNPSKGLVFIKNDTELISSDYEVSIYDLKGSEIYKNEKGKFDTTINLSSLNPGIYFVKIKNDGSSQVEKLVID